ncbi:MAG TPA: molybdopterin-dependent oxidoreductase, partial [Dehalococcoidales bacterium]|nr:molybdopterin-dependent oxidoreductase [Dehalococcoidales bacterium]
GVIEPAYPCYRACPAGIDIPRYIRLIAKGRPEAALAVIREKVPFPGVLGRVCVHPCEGVCQRGLEIDKPLGIRILKRYAADNGGDAWKSQVKQQSSTGKKVAVIGSGPAGLTVAYYLNRLGHTVTVFEALSAAGGMMRVGIPSYRLPREILTAEIDEITKAGVEIKLKSRIDSPQALLKQGFNAVFVGVGAHQGIKLGIEGGDSQGILDAAEFLRRVNLGERISVGKRVGIIGGGNVALDAARTSLRLGAKQVTIFYRRTRMEMPANPEEIEAAIDEGIEIIYLATPFRAVRENEVLKLECQRVKLGKPDASGRRHPVLVQGRNFITELDTIVSAIGQRPSVPESFDIKTEKGNTVAISEKMMSSVPGIFAGGDCVRGPATVIEAIADGRKAASAIDIFLGGTGDISESLVPPRESVVWQERDLPEEKTVSIKNIAPDSRINNFDEVELALPQSIAQAEAARCLKCYTITPTGDKKLDDANCQFCGACVDACPTGALVEKSILKNGKPEKTVKTICPYCGVGCQLNLDIEKEKIVRVCPDPEGPANYGQACVKGKFGLDFVHSPDRLRTPLIRIGDKGTGNFREASWEEALDLIAEKFTVIKQKSGADSLAFLSSAKCTNEENYLMQKLARAVIGTNNIDHCARLCHSPSVAGLSVSFGSGAMTNSIEEIDHAECIFIIGSNTSESHPVVALEVMKAVRHNGTKLIVADPRKIRMTDFASIWLQQKPGTDTALINGLINVIISEGLYDAKFVRNRTEGFDELKKSVKSYTPAKVSALTGIPKDKLIDAARLYARSKKSNIIFCMGITQHTSGTDNVMALANLAMVTGHVGKKNSGVNPLRGQNNVQGACDMGALPDVYPGYQKVKDPAAREKLSSAWGVALPSNPGLTLLEIMHGITGGKIKGIYIMGEEPVITDPNSKTVREGLKNL